MVLFTTQQKNTNRTTVDKHLQKFTVHSDLCGIEIVYAKHFPGSAATTFIQCLYGSYEHKLTADPWEVLCGYLCFTEVERKTEAVLCSVFNSREQILTVN